MSIIKAKLSRKLREKLLDEGFVANPFDKIGYQKFVKFDRLIIKPNGLIEGWFEGEMTFSIDSQTDMNISILYIDGIEGRMTID